MCEAISDQEEEAGLAVTLAKSGSAGGIAPVPLNVGRGWEVGGTMVDAAGKTDSRFVGEVVIDVGCAAA